MPSEVTLGHCATWKTNAKWRGFYCSRCHTREISLACLSTLRSLLACRSDLSSVQLVSVMVTTEMTTVSFVLALYLYQIKKTAKLPMTLKYLNSVLFTRLVSNLKNNSYALLDLRS